MPIQESGMDTYSVKIPLEIQKVARKSQHNSSTKQFNVALALFKQKYWKLYSEAELTIRPNILVNNSTAKKSNNRYRNQ